MVTKKKKPAPKPVACECWCAVGTRTSGFIHPTWCTLDEDRVDGWRKAGCRVIRVRIVPVAAKRRKGGK